MPSNGFSGLLTTRHYKKPEYFQRAIGSNIFEKIFGYLLGFSLLVLVTIIRLLPKSICHHSRLRISPLLIPVFRAKMTIGRKYALLPNSILISRDSSSTDK